jgi:ATP-binding cassette subfamily B protein IrtA
MSLPKGYNTLAGDGGGNLSGGERQRIAIARAILKNSPVVVLDEATAFTDPENEAVIQASINELVRGKTLIVIAHRLGTIVEADKIIVMNGGKIESLGTHTELLVTCPLYETSAPSGMRNCAEIWGSIPLRAHCFWRMGIGIPF